MDRVVAADPEPGRGDALPQEGQDGSVAAVVGGWRPLHIAMVGQKGIPARYGGVEHHVEEIGARLVARGHRVTVFCRRGYGCRREQTYLGMQLVPTSTIASKHLDAFAHSVTSTVRALDLGVDVVHYHALGPGLLAPVPRYLSRTPVVQTVHGLDHRRAKWGRTARAVLTVAHQVSARVPDQLVVVSEDLREHYLETFRRDCLHIDNGVAAVHPVPVERASRLLGLGAPPPPYVLSVGRLVPEKGVDLLLDAFRGVDTDAHLVVVGDSCFSDEYVRRLRALAARDPRVHLVGFVYGDDLAALYQHCAVFVQPSVLEGLPLTLLEAVAHDAAVVATDLPPHEEVLGAGSPRHLLVPVADTGAMARALSRVLGGRPARDASSDLVRERVVRRYSWDRATDQLEQAYLSLARRSEDHRPWTHQTATPVRAGSVVGGRGAR